MEKNRKIDIQHPEAWDLIALIDDRRVDYILYTDAVANSLVTGHVEMTESTLQALEDAIYETPDLLSEYKRVRVIINSRHFIILPMETSDEDCLTLVARAYPGIEADGAVCPLPRNGVKIAYLMPQGMQAFLGRTFNYPTVCHHLLPLCEHYAGLNRGTDISRMFLNLNDSSMDLAIYREGKLMCANSYRFTNDEDATYFAMNAWRTYSMDQLTDEMQLTGDRDRLAAMTPQLREYVKYVMPAVYPAEAMHLGRNAMQAPLELILLALCE